MIQFQCPACSAFVRAPKKAAGKRIACPRCGKGVEVPDEEFFASPAPVDASNSGETDGGAEEDDWLADLPRPGALAETPSAENETDLDPARPAGFHAAPDAKSLQELLDVAGRGKPSAQAARETTASDVAPSGDSAKASTKEDVKRSEKDSNTDSAKDEGKPPGKSHPLIPDLGHPVKRKVILAAAGMLGCAMLSLFLVTMCYVPVVFYLFYNVVAAKQNAAPCLTGSCMLLTLLSGIYYVFVLVRSVHMLLLTDREQALIAAYMVMMPCGPCFVIGLPIGLRAVKVLREEDVKALFKR